MHAKMKKLEKLQREIKQLGHQKTKISTDKENERPGKFNHTCTIF